jgi:hypothetical protein
MIASSGVGSLRIAVLFDGFSHSKRVAQIVRHQAHAEY